MGGVYSGVDGLELQFTFVDDETGNPIDLATATAIEVRLKRPGGAATLVYTLADSEVEIVDAPTGRANVVTAPDEVDRDGRYWAQGLLTTNAGVFPSDVFKFTVQKSVAAP